MDQDDSTTSYFELYSRDLLVQAIRHTLSSSTLEPKPDLKPYRLLMSLLDKTEIGPVILDDILLDLFRTLYKSCQDTKCDDVLKSSNMLLSSLEPFYIWDYAGLLFAKCCKSDDGARCDIMELCVLLEYLLDTLPLETYVDTISEHLPKLFIKLTDLLIKHLDKLTMDEMYASLSLCTKIVGRIQTMVVTSSYDDISTRLSSSMHEINQEHSPGLEKSKSDSKLNNSMDSPKKMSPRKLFRKKKQNKMKSLDSLNTTTSSDDVAVEDKVVCKSFVSLDTIKPDEKQSLLEKCIHSYQDLYTSFIALKVLSFTGKTKRTKVSELFEVLLNDGTKIYDIDVSVKTLENILNSLDVPKTTQRLDVLDNLTSLKFIETQNDIKLIDTIKLSCRLLVELSSFPTYSLNDNQHIQNDKVHEGRQLSEWLKVLSLCACLFKSEPEVQLCAISTLLDLTSLLKTQQESRESTVGVTAVVVIPLMRQWHIEYLERNTKVFQILAYTLWNHLGDAECNQSDRMLMCAQLLYQLHDCVSTASSPAERVIGESMGPDKNNEQRLESFQR